jgi:phenylpropionate dioxygenase-like ring-hydroxylating dioxygenase large terminal subunit
LNVQLKFEGALMNVMNTVSEGAPVLDDAARGGLAPWTYFNRELFDIEQEELFRRHWQLACHVSDVPAAGDWYAFDIVGERAIIVRGKDGVVRAFHNVCRHRGSRVVAGEKGRCKTAMVCPFHGWSFNLDGTLRAVPKARTFPKLDPLEHGLIPVEHEIWHGFIFVRFKQGPQATVAELMAGHETEAAAYRLGEIKPYVPQTRELMEVNWKSVRDVDNEGYHVPVAHPALHDLYGQHYRDSRYVAGVNRSEGRINGVSPRCWSVRNYVKLRPKMTYLPAEAHDRWVYLGVFPNLVLMLYPELIGFYQEVPIGVGKTIQRMAYYAPAADSREARAARYLAHRIDKMTGAEDTQLIKWSWEAMQSSGFNGLILSDLEAGVRDYHDILRRSIPVSALEVEPPPGQVGIVNQSLRAGRAQAGRNVSEAFGK